MSAASTYPLHNAPEAQTHLPCRTPLSWLCQTDTRSSHTWCQKTVPNILHSSYFSAISRLRSKCDGTRAETRLRLSAKRTSPFKSAGASVQSITGSWGVRISGSNAGYAMFRGSVKSTGYPLHSPVSPSLLLPCVTVCHHISTGVYKRHSNENHTKCMSIQFITYNSLW
jgi:hypothetical protein